MHICVSKLTIIGSDNGLSPGRRQPIIWTNAGILLIRPLETNFSDILIKIHIFSFKKIHLKMSSGRMASILSRPQWVNWDERPWGGCMGWEVLCHGVVPFHGAIFHQKLLVTQTPEIHWAGKQALMPQCNKCSINTRHQTYLIFHHSTYTLDTLNLPGILCWMFLRKHKIYLQLTSFLNIEASQIVDIHFWGSKEYPHWIE